MVLESTIVCVDNSEFARNGDFAPSRFACQVDSVNMLCCAKVQANAESSVGLLTLAGRSARIMVTSTRDLGRIFTCMHDVRYDGLADVVKGIQKAQLALKHRQNSLQRQRIVVFVSSPIMANKEALLRLGKTLKKNSVAVDVINIGVEGENIDKVDAFIDAVNSNDNSHALHVEAGGPNLADALMNSDVYLERDGSGSASLGHGAPGDGADTADFGGMDAAAVDPELAMVLRISMEEERARQASARAAAEATAAESAPGPSLGGASDSAPPGEAAMDSAKFDDDDADLYGTAGQIDIEADEEAEMLRRAIELSKADADVMDAPGADDKNDNDGHEKKGSW